MIEVSIVQLVCVAICGINCGVSIMLTRDAVLKWKEARSALKMAQDMLKVTEDFCALQPENTEPLTSEENERV